MTVRDDLVEGYINGLLLKLYNSVNSNVDCMAKIGVSNEEACNFVESSWENWYRFLKNRGNDEERIKRSRKLCKSSIRHLMKAYSK